MNIMSGIEVDIGTSADIFTSIVNNLFTVSFIRERINLNNLAIPFGFYLYMYWLYLWQWKTMRVWGSLRLAL